MRKGVVFTKFLLKNSWNCCSIEFTLFWLLRNFSVKSKQNQQLLHENYSVKMLLLRKTNSSKSFQATCYICLLSKILWIFTWKLVWPRKIADLRATSKFIRLGTKQNWQFSEKTKICGTLESSPEPRKWI